MVGKSIMIKNLWPMKREDTASCSNDKILIREKMRLSLRGYLKSLMKIPEVAHCTILSDFLTTNKTTLTR